MNAARYYMHVASHFFDLQTSVGDFFCPEWYKAIKNNTEMPSKPDNPDDVMEEEDGGLFDNRFEENCEFTYTKIIQSHICHY